MNRDFDNEQVNKLYKQKTNKKILAILFVFAISVFLLALMSVLNTSFAAEETTKKITVTKKWENDTGYENKRPDNITIHIKKKTAELITGEQLSTKMKSLTGASNTGPRAENTTVTGFKKATKEQYNAKASSLTTNNEIQSSGSSEKVYMWADNGTIYFYSEADNIYLNADSRSMFSKMRNLTDISGVQYFNTTYVTNMAFMFEDCTGMTDISALSNWDVSNVTSMRFMLGAGATSAESTHLKYTSLEPIKNWNTQKVTDMGSLFKGAKGITDLTPIKDWNVSNVANMQQMFNRTGITSLEDLSVIMDWDVTRVGGTYANMGNNGASATGNFEMIFANLGFSNSDLPSFTKRSGSWTGNANYTPSSGPVSGSAPTITKVKDTASEYTNASSNATVTKNGSTWTYEFEVSNDGSKWSVWEDTNNGKIADKDGDANAYQESSGGTNNLGSSETNAITGVTDSATITNTNMKRKQIKVTKQWQNDTGYETKRKDITLHLKKNGTEVEQSDNTKWDKSGGNIWKYEFVVYDIDPITDYKVSEDDVPSYSNNGEQSVSNISGTINGEATIINTLMKHDIILECKVTGNMAKTDKEFNYTITIHDGDTAITDNLTIERSGISSSIANGSTIKLKHNEQITIKNIINGYKYSIVEAEDDDDYTELYKIENTDETDQSEKILVGQTTGTTITKQELTENHTVTFINNKEKSTLTGVYVNSDPFKLLLFIAVVLIIGIVLLNRDIAVSNRKRVKGKRFIK